ncbi:MAG: DUF1549 domain-containing protein [Planctomycetaceae bacterium]|nr:DUF1549 domain-containing protein [Planctomycetaceae bacterium]
MMRYKCSAILRSAGWLVLGLAISSSAAITRSAALAGPLGAVEAARRVDRLLSKELPQDSLTASNSPAPPDLKSADVGEPQVDDETYLRRVTFDLVGELPSPEEVTQFVLDSSPNKRKQLVDRLLADEKFGENWGRYWRDAVLYRRSDDRALIASQSVEQYLKDEFNRGAHWDEIAREFIAAKGKLNEAGATALIASQWGEVPETAAEVSRIFLGVQIQCAQCHDHPTDRWKREQFHELAAFFARIAVRPVIDNGQRKGFELTSSDMRFKDRTPAQQAKIKANLKGKKNARLEHFMPDLQDPTAEGKLMEPVLFLTGQKMEPGASDDERRATLANWIASPENPWFAKAFVNRVWGELVGVGFYEPIDDLGPDRPCGAPKTLDFLARQFAEHDFDVKWLYRTIVGTQVYGAPSRPRSPNGDNVPTTACVQPLRADQLFNALTMVLEVEETQIGAAPDKTKGYRGPRTARALFQQVFGFDPSTPRDELAATIPQALLMMNQPGLNRALSAEGPTGRRPGTMLARLLEETENDEDVVVDLYLRCFAREPKPNELKTCLDYVREVGNRTEAFEDVLWSLVNSTEFLYR